MKKIRLEARGGQVVGTLEIQDVYDPNVVVQALRIFAYHDTESIGDEVVIIYREADVYFAGMFDEVSDSVDSLLEKSQ